MRFFQALLCLLAVCSLAFGLIMAFHAPAYAEDDCTDLEPGDPGFNDWQDHCQSQNPSKKYFCVLDGEWCCYPTLQPQRDECCEGDFPEWNCFGE